MASFPVSHPFDLTVQLHVRTLIDCPDFVLQTDERRLGFMFQVPPSFRGEVSDIMSAIIEAQRLSMSAA